MPGYQTKQESVAIQGAHGLRIQSLLDRQQFADPDGEAEAVGISSAMWPLFGLLWPSSQELASWMERRATVPQERILEVGCGLALASLVMHRRGEDVTASDCHPLTSRFLSDNTALNDMAPLPYRHGNWADADDAPVRAGRPVVEGRFDLIMGSDVLYERDESGHLSRFIARHAQPTAEVLIVDPNRGNRSGFNRRMAAEGFALEEVDLSHAREGVAPYRGRMLRYKR
ncbi:methyltransferase domain-containing protein [Aquabacterium sp.]|uniref:class I SAM-dependent methyltransferase n=1 Tax=Aquabacterium sp. TaxID=1872578 RepID=UPI0024874D3D|nr:methyltransferase domain-containing protein [Aquabacterium sp.]MDI1348891.1 SAM-dependent methyltransferase [Aquabacterium sp.]